MINLKPESCTTGYNYREGVKQGHAVKGLVQESGAHADIP